MVVSRVRSISNAIRPSSCASGAANSESAEPKGELAADQVLVGRGRNDPGHESELGPGTPSLIRHRWVPAATGSPAISTSRVTIRCSH